MSDGTLSEETGKRAISFGKFAKGLNIGEPIVIFNIADYGDVAIYILANKDSMVIVYCTPMCYLVTHGKKNHMTAGGADYLMVDKMQVFLRALKKKGYGFVSREELTDLQKIYRQTRRIEDGPTDKDLKEIEDDDED